MYSVRVVDEAGNGKDYEVEFIPRIGERIVLVYGTNREPIRPHYFRVKDVAFHLDHKPGDQITILIEEANPLPWPNDEGR
jgi:hypothetical protein